MIKYNRKFKNVTTLYDFYDYPLKSAEAETLANKAVNLKEKGQYKKAILLFKKSINIEPNPELYLELSTCFSKTNLLDEAIHALDSAILLDSTYWGFYTNRGLIYYKTNQSKRAIEDFNNAVRLDSTKWIPHANLALVYRKEKDLQRACEALDNAKSLGLDLSSHPIQDELEELEKKCKN